MGRERGATSPAVSFGIHGRSLLSCDVIVNGYDHVHVLLGFLFLFPSYLSSSHSPDPQCRVANGTVCLANPFAFLLPSPFLSMAHARTYTARIYVHICILDVETWGARLR